MDVDTSSTSQSQGIDMNAVCHAQLVHVSPNISPNGIPLYRFYGIITNIYIAALFIKLSFCPPFDFYTYCIIAGILINFGMFLYSVWKMK